MKRLCTILLALGLLLTLAHTAHTASGADWSGLRILVDGKAIDASGAYITEEGVTMVPLRAVMEALGCKVEWDGGAQTVIITTSGAEASPADVPAYDALVVLDPGHGGSATGAGYGGAQEKDLNLSIALQAAELLEEAGVGVIMTRRDDRDVDLYARTDMANGQGADLFVSVHCNASVDHDDALGIYTCAYSEDGEGWRLAETLYGTMQEATGAAGFGMEARPDLAVLRTSKMPAALVECGFMTTAEELAQLVRPEYQARLARGIADGVLAYLAQS